MQNTQPKTEIKTSSIQNLKQPMPVEVEGIDKVREILFGDAEKIQDQKMRAHQEAIETEIFRMRREYLERLDTLSEFFKKEIRDLTSKNDQGQKAMELNLSKVSKNLETYQTETENRLKSISTIQSNSVSEIRTWFLDSMGKLSKELHTLYQEMSLEIKRDLKSLHEKKMDRSLFKEISFAAAEKAQEGEYASDSKN